MYALYTYSAPINFYSYLIELYDHRDLVPID